MRRTIIPWIAAFGILALATVGGVWLVNATTFSAGSFVHSYLEAVARGDSESALALPGVDDGGARDALLAPDALAGLENLEQLADDDLGDGRHRVSYAWDSPGGSGTTDFTVERIGTRFGLFPRWGFAVSPTATVALSVQHDSGFFANDVDADTGAGSAGPVDYAVLVPGTYTFGHESAFFEADPQTVLVDEPGAEYAVDVDVQANGHFVEQVQAQVDEYLDVCAGQDVLFPTDCPFGQAIKNRVSSDPVWSIVEQPSIRLEPGEEFGTWRVPAAPGTARLEVDVESLFDGSITHVDKKLDFTVAYLITFTGPTTIRIEAVD